MPLYECVIIARNDVTQQQVEAIAATIGAQIDSEAGIAPPAADEIRSAACIKKQEYWGLRGLAYRIKKNRKGHYVLLNINAPSNAVVELERQLKINEDVLRYITVKVDQFDVSSSKARRDDKPEGAKPEGEAEEILV